MEERATAMATANPPQSISDWYHSCIESFEALNTMINNLATPGLDSGTHETKTFVLQLVRDQIGRFRVWGGNMGAHHPRGNAMSLDYKLKEASHIHNTVRELLEELNSSLLEALGNLETDGGDEEKGVNREEFDDDISDSGGAISGSGSLLSDIVFLLDDTSDVISCLYNLSVAIRQPVPEDRLRKYASIDVSHYEFFDNQHVLEKFPSAKPFLIKRLGNANTQRRQYFKYRLRHYEKISHGLEHRVPSISVANPPQPINPVHRGADPGQSNYRSILNTTNQDLDSAATVITAAITSTTISIVPGNTMVHTQPALDIIEVTSDGGRTATSFGTIMETGPVKLLKVPDPPGGDKAFAKNADKADNAFQCPYCYSLIIVKNRKDWRRHVFRDLRPYVCTFETCTKPNRLFETRHDWYDHEKQHYQPEWYCAECTVAFRTSSDLTDHLKQTHPALVLLEAQDISALVGNCKRALSTPQQCPLCPRQSEHQLRSHLGRHMQQLALFTLPRLAGDDDEGGDVPSKAGLNGRESESRGDEDAEEGMSQLEFDSNPGEERPGEEGMSELEFDSNLGDEHPREEKEEQEEAVATGGDAEGKHEAKSELEKRGIDESKLREMEAKEVAKLREYGLYSLYSTGLLQRQQERRGELSNGTIATIEEIYYGSERLEYGEFRDSGSFRFGYKRELEEGGIFF